MDGITCAVSWAFMVGDAVAAGAAVAVGAVVAIGATVAVGTVVFVAAGTAGKVAVAATELEEGACVAVALAGATVGAAILQDASTNAETRLIPISLKSIFGLLIIHLLFMAGTSQFLTICYHAANLKSTDGLFVLRELI